MKHQCEVGGGISGICTNGFIYVIVLSYFNKLKMVKQKMKKELCVGSKWCKCNEMYNRFIFFERCKLTCKYIEWFQWV